MFAWVSRLDEAGNTRCGTSGNYCTAKYKSIKTLQKYFLDKLPLGNYKVAIHWSEDTKYRTNADKTFLHKQKA